MGQAGAAAAARGDGSVAAAGAGPDGDVAMEEDARGDAYDAAARDSWGELEGRARADEEADDDGMCHLTFIDCTRCKWPSPALARAHALSLNGP